MRGIRTRKSRTFATLAFVGIMASASYAFMASNTVGATNAGQGSDTISGYTAGAIQYALDTSGSTANVTGVSFTLTPDAGGSAPSVVRARLTAAGAYQNCTLASGRWSCTFSGVTALSAASLDIAASS